MSLANLISLALVSLIILLGFFSTKQNKIDTSHLEEDKMVLLEPNLRLGNTDFCLPQILYSDVEVRD